MSLASISPAASHLWQLTFYETEHGRLRRASRVTCCWASVLIILEIREQNEAREAAHAAASEQLKR